MIRLFVCLNIFAFCCSAAETINTSFNCKRIGGNEASSMNRKYRLELKPEQLILNNSYTRYVMHKDSNGTGTLVEDGVNNQEDILKILNTNNDFISATDTFKTSRGEMVLLQAMYQINTGQLVLQEVYSTETSDKTPVISSQTIELKCGADAE